jgi:hypothetical protein
MFRRLLASAIVAAGCVTAAAAAETGRSFVIPANDGYGLGECLATGAPCGRLVADAWCEAQGLGKAESFGPADATDVTGTVRVTQAAQPQHPAQAYVVTCHE